MKGSWVVGLLVLVACTPPVERPAVVMEAEAINLEAMTRFSNPKSTVGELVYVPIYSSAYHKEGRNEHLLTATLSVHNVNLRGTIELTAVSYFDTSGRRLREFIDTSAVLKPLETKQFVIPREDQTGGTGANFVVKWEAQAPTPRPVIEGLMISTSGQQGISFITQSTVIESLTSTAPAAK